MRIEEELRKYIVSKYGTLKQFALICDIPTPTMTVILKKGIKSTSVGNLATIAHKLNIDLDSLVNGSIREKPNVSWQDLTSEEYELVEKFDQLSSYDRATIFLMINRMIDKENKNLITIMPMLIENTEKKDNFVLTTKDLISEAGITDKMLVSKLTIPTYEIPAGTDFIINMIEDTMKPLFSAGDKLLVERQNALNEGDVGVFEVNGNIVVRKLSDNSLKPLNDDYESIPFDDSITVIGRVLKKM